MADLNQKLAEIESQIEKILIKAQIYKAEKEALAAENKRLRKMVEAHDQKIEELENKNLSLQLSRSIVHGKGETLELKEQLEQYIQDIDQCLALLKANADQKT